MDIPRTFEWPASWHTVMPEVGIRLAAQLNREVKKGHVLFGVPVTCLARRGDNDDVLFLLDGGTAVAIVHLTYNVTETNPGYPHTFIFSDLEAWIQKADTKEERML